MVMCLPSKQKNRVQVSTRAPYPPSPDHQDGNTAKAASKYETSYEPKTEKALTLADIMKVRDAVGHEHGADGRFGNTGGGASPAGDAPAGDGFAASSEYVKPDDPGGVEIRPDGWKAGNDALGEMTRPGHLYRGMTSDEFEAHKKAGFIQSSGAYSHKSEGTCFDDNAPSAEGYANYGRDDPRVTGKPTYMVEIKHDPEQTPQDKRDYYYKAPNPIGLDKVTRAWKMHALGDAVVAHKIHDAEPETEKALTLADILKDRDAVGHDHGEDGRFTGTDGGATNTAHRPRSRTCLRHSAGR